jgi:hypothetical protein
MADRQAMLARVDIDDPRCGWGGLNTAEQLAVRPDARGQLTTAMPSVFFMGTRIDRSPP